MKSKLWALGLALVLSTLILSGCGPAMSQPTESPTAAPLSTEAEATPVSSTLTEVAAASPTPSAEVPTTAPPTATPISPTSIPPTVIPVPPTTTPRQGWQLYINDVYGYQFSYPASAAIAEIGVMGFPTDELPEGMSPDQYIAQLEEKYSDKLCISVGYKLGYVNISAPPNKEFRYALCGRTGVGAGDIVEKSEAVMIAGQTHTARGFEFIGGWDPCETLDCHNETFVVILADATRIEYGAAPSSTATYEDYLETTKTVLLSVLASYEPSD